MPAFHESHSMSRFTDFPNSASLNINRHLLTSRTLNCLLVMKPRRHSLDSITDTLNQLNAAPSTKIQVALPNLNTNGRVCFYGYGVATEWLIDYANKHWKGIEEYDDLAKASAGLHLLRAHSGIKRLSLESAVKDPKAPIDTVTIPGRIGETRVPLVSIFSNEVSSFPRRPSQAKIDRLSEILGGKQPRWWVDYEDPESYGY